MIHGYFLPEEIDDMPLCPVRADMGICALTTSKLADPIRLTQVGLLRLLGDPSDELTLAVAHARATGASLGPEYDAALAWVDALDRWHRRFEARLGRHGHRLRTLQAEDQRREMRLALAVWEVAQRAIACVPSKPHALGLLLRAPGFMLHVGLRRLLVLALQGVEPAPVDGALAALAERDIDREMSTSERAALVWFCALWRASDRLPVDVRVSWDVMCDQWDAVLQEIDA